MLPLKSANIELADRLTKCVVKCLKTCDDSHFIRCFHSFGKAILFQRKRQQRCSFQTFEVHNILINAIGSNLNKQSE